MLSDAGDVRREETAKLKPPCSMVPGKPGEIECTRSCMRPCEEAERWLAKQQKKAPKRRARLGASQPKRREQQQQASSLRLPGGHAILILTRTELAILERLITDRLLSLRMTCERGREVEAARGRTRALGTRISRLVADAGNGAQVPDPFNVSIHEVLILDDLVEPLTAVQDDAACEALLDKIETIILSAASEP